MTLGDLRKGRFMLSQYCEGGADVEYYMTPERCNKKEYYSRYQNIVHRPCATLGDLVALPKASSQDLVGSCGSVSGL